MADAHLIALASDSVSDHLHAIEVLGSVLCGAQENGGSRPFPYDVCLAFQLLAGAAKEQFNIVDAELLEMRALKRDMDALAKAAA